MNMIEAVKLVDKYILIDCPRGKCLLKCLGVKGTYKEYATGIEWLMLYCKVYKHDWAKNIIGTCVDVQLFPDGRDWKVITEEEFKIEVI